MLPKPVLVKFIEVVEDLFLPGAQGDLLASIVAFRQAAKVLNERRDL